MRLASARNEDGLTGGLRPDCFISYSTMDQDFADKPPNSDGDIH
jgi:hypothetical protein